MDSDKITMNSDKKAMNSDKITMNSDKKAMDSDKITRPLLPFFE